MAFFGGIEAGGTKFNCIVASDPHHVVAEATFPTVTPEVTLPQVVQFFKQTEIGQNLKLSAIGIACFGPVNLDRNDPQFGSITSTPKLQWQNAPLLNMLKAHFDLPFGFDTDVNGAAIGEGAWGAGQGLTDFAYVTVGTGIGAGIIVNGQPIHGLIHPELGHMLLKHDPDRDPFAGSCPFHGDCLEGLASGPAITKRWGVSSQELPPDHPAWELEAVYLGQAVHNLCVAFSPKRVILGGGVMKVPDLLDKIRNYAQRSLNGYLDSDLIKHHMDEFIVPPGLGDRAGSLGAIVLASMAAQY